jgi:type IV pilus assembly protein PilQ
MTAVLSIGTTPTAERIPASPQTMSPEAAARGITIRAHKPTNSIFIRHYEKDIERIKKLIRETLDVELPMIRIEGRVVTLSRTDLLDVGVQWGGAGAGRDSERVLVAQGIGSVPAGTAATSPAITPFQRGTPASRASLPLTGLLPVSGITGLPLGGNLINLPVTGGAPAGGINFGIIGTRFNVNMAIQALETKANTRILARPEIVVTDNNKATIVRGTEIGYQTGTAQTGFSVAFKDAALKLEVTPTVIREPSVTKIKMKISLENNTPGDVIAGVPSITKQTTQTEVVVKEGETLVIGGVTQRTDRENITKVPLFGDIPLFGWLFKKRFAETNPNDELTVFITPTILRDLPRGGGPTTPPTR